MKKICEAYSILFVLLAFFSCSESEEEISTSIEKLPEVSLIGSIQLFNKFESENKGYSDIEIEVFDSSGNFTIAKVDSLGMYEIDDLNLGDFIIKIDKPGYVGISSYRVTNTEQIDTLSKIILTEEMPFDFDLNEVYYEDGLFYYNHSTDFNSNGASYMVGVYFCFSTKPEFSINACEYRFVGGGFTNVNWLSSTSINGTGLSTNRFINSGINIDNQIFVKLYAVAKNTYNGYPELNFEVLTYSHTNASNTLSFIIP